MKALISPNENNRIAEVSAIPFEVAPPLHWVDCLDTVTSEWTYNGIDFIPPVIHVPEVPKAVSMRQARLALLQSGLLSTVNAAIAAGGHADQITWEYAAEVDRNSPLVLNMKAGLNLTDADLDNLFTLAASL